MGITLKSLFQYFSFFKFNHVENHIDVSSNPSRSKSTEGCFIFSINHLFYFTSIYAKLIVYEEINKYLMVLIL